MRVWYHNQIERPVSFGLEIIVPITKLWILSNDITKWSPGTATSLLCSLLSLIPKLEVPAGQWATPDKRAILRTMQKISKDVIPLDILSRGGGVLASAGSQWVSELKIRHVFSEVGRTIPKFSNTQLILAQIAYSTVYRVLFDSPKIRAVCTMEEIRKLSSQRNLEKVRSILLESHSWSIGDVEVVRKYGSCLDIFTLVSSLNIPTKETRTKINQIMPSVNLALSALKTHAYYVDICNDLLFNKIIFYLAYENAQDYLIVKTILVEEISNLKIYAQVVIFLVEQAEIRAGKDTIKQKITFN